MKKERYRSNLVFTGLHLSWIYLFIYAFMHLFIYCPSSGEPLLWMTSRQHLSESDAARKSQTRAFFKLSLFYCKMSLYLGIASGQQYTFIDDLTAKGSNSSEEGWATCGPPAVVGQQLTQVLAVAVQHHLEGLTVSNSALKVTCHL